MEVSAPVTVSADMRLGAVRAMKRAEAMMRKVMEAYRGRSSLIGLAVGKKNESRFMRTGKCMIGKTKRR